MVRSKPHPIVKYLYPATVHGMAGRGMYTLKKGMLSGQTQQQQTGKLYSEAILTRMGEVNHQMTYHTVSKLKLYFYMKNILLSMKYGQPLPEILSTCHSAVCYNFHKWNHH